MMRMRTKTKGCLDSPLKSEISGNGGGGVTAAATAEEEWEVRPGGMLVQRRSSGDSNGSSVPVPMIRVRVKYGSNQHEISISSQATFGELKKKLTGPTGLHHQDQKLLFKDKERDSNSYLDDSGVKDRSKIVLLEDLIGREKRLLEMRRTAKMEKASKSISEIGSEVDKLAGKVSALELEISKCGKVAERDVVNLIELLMNQLLKLDGIIADGDLKLQRKMQARRVQKYVETLDLLKMKTSRGKVPMNPQHKHSNGQMQPSRDSTWSPVVVTTKWETFESPPASVLAPFPSTSSSVNPKLNWELFE